MEVVVAIQNGALFRALEVLLKKENFPPAK